MSKLTIEDIEALRKQLDEAPVPTPYYFYHNGKCIPYTQEPLKLKELFPSLNYKVT